MPPPGAHPSKHYEAWTLWCENHSIPEIAAILGCAISTASDWIDRGWEMEAQHGGPNSRRKARRYAAYRGLGRLSTKAAQDIENGLWPERATYYEYQRKVIMDRVRVMGDVAPTPKSRVKVEGLPAGQPLDPLVERALAALAPKDALDDEDDEAAG